MGNECRSVPQNLDRNWNSYQDMYRALVREGKVPEGTDAVPDTFVNSQSFSYMSDTLNNDKNQKRAINLGLFNDLAARECLLKWAGFKDDDIANVQTILQDPTAEANAALKDQMEGHLNNTQKSLFKAMRIVAGYQKPAAEEGGNKANPDDKRDIGDPNVITDYEIEENAGAAVGSFEGEDYHKQIKSQMRSINAVLGLLEFVTTVPKDLTPVQMAAGQKSPGGEVTIAPLADHPFPEGAQIFLDDAKEPLKGATIDPVAGISIPFEKISAGEHTMTIKDREGNVFGTAKVTTSDKPTAKVDPTPPPSNSGGISVDDIGDAGTPDPSPKTGSGNVPVDGIPSDGGGHWGTVVNAVEVGLAVVGVLYIGNLIRSAIKRLVSNTVTADAKASVDTKTETKNEGAKDEELIKQAEEEAKKLAANGAKPKSVLIPTSEASVANINPEIVREQILAYYPELDHTDYRGEKLSDGSRTKNLVDDIVRITIERFSNPDKRPPAFDSFGGMKGGTPEELWLSEGKEVIKGSIAESFVRASVAVVLNDMREVGMFSKDKSQIELLYQNSEEFARKGRDRISERARDVFERAVKP